MATQQFSSFVKIVDSVFMVIKCFRLFSISLTGIWSTFYYFANVYFKEYSLSTKLLQEINIDQFIIILIIMIIIINNITIIGSSSSNIITIIFSIITITLNYVNRMKVFIIPSWIPKLKEPNIPFNLSPPTYQEITRIIKHMKSSGSPCLLYQISIICFKRCPYLRSFMLNICAKVLRSNTLPAQWTKAATIFIHKKGDPSLLESFRPITLEPVSLGKVTSLFQNRVFTCLINNQCIESHYQEGFMPGMISTFEHIAEVSHIINHSRKQQQSVTITLTNLKHNFGEVHYSLI